MGQSRNTQQYHNNNNQPLKILDADKRLLESGIVFDPRPVNGVVMPRYFTLKRSA